ncbi:MAG TPA: DUF402 domain-containing protein [Nitrospirota bacterium]|nr:DUF402 domain-containing protein [Nitrospirota bacterium]
MLLSGEVHTYSCELIYYSTDFGILKYIIKSNYDLNGVKLAPGDITYSLYWINRPYTLYIWQLNNGKDVAYYFNVADKISLKPSEFIWRDLVIDILIDPKRNVHIIDEDELPPDLNPELSHYIESTKALIIHDLNDILQEAGTLLDKLSHVRL